MKGINLIVFKDGQSLDMTQLVEKIEWKGRKGSSARTLGVTLIDDDGFQHARSGIDVERGCQCVFSCDGAERFRGMFMFQRQGRQKRMELTAYDNGIYLANNQDTFLYENKTADQVFRDCCSRYGIPVGEVASCSYKIPELTETKTTAYDAILDALSQEYDATGIRHYVVSDKGRLSLLTRRENILQWVIEAGQNLINYDYTRSIEDVRTRIKMVTNDGTGVAEASDSALESRIGIFQEVMVPDENLTEAEINNLVKSVLAEKSAPKRVIDLECLGIPDVISGIGVFIIIPELGINRTFYVDEDTHVFEDNKHTMRLSLTAANDLNREASGGGAVQDGYQVGDIVQFNGGYHYISSSASSPTGSKCQPGPAKITLRAKGAKHPWHLIHTNSQSRVYGWVDEGTFS
ncbi:MAG: hypothetical protein IJT94_03680 [Oscillibacter sp.]|nr:hypothetical protein [Oscillibacter sp.]